MSSLQAGTTANGLKLIAQEHQGQLKRSVWNWPEGASKVRFDDILNGMGVVSMKTHFHARHCSLVRAGSLMHPMWLLANTGREMVCTVNQGILPAGSQVRLDHGDEIELGLTRLMVSLGASVETPKVANSNAERLSGSEDSNFKLTDLDALADITSLPDHERYGIDRADFSDLITFNAKEIIPEPAPTVAPASTTELPSLAEALAAGGSQNPPGKVSDILTPFGTEKATAPGEGVPVADPFDALHAQYLSKLRNPTHADANDLWKDRELSNQSKLPDPMEQWMHAAGKSHSLDDLLSQQESIRSIVNSLDPLGTSDILEPQPFDSVLQLFAPEHLRADHKTALQTLTQYGLPGITQREHHQLSLDSAMPFTGGEDQPPKQPKQPKP
jgi:hypothetical protein